MKIFPTLAGKRCGSINLDACLRHDETLGEYLRREGKSPVLQALHCERFVQNCHRRRAIDWSWGGYLEDRSSLWKGSYLDHTGGYIHLGVDFNVPVGTPVVAHGECQVVVVDDDAPEAHGWGNRVIVRDWKSGNYVVYAHLSRPACQELDHLKEGQLIGRVGDSSCNGGWYPHLHLQVVHQNWWGDLSRDLRRLDGYGHKKDLQFIRAAFPHPVVELRL